LVIEKPAIPPVFNFTITRLLPSPGIQSSSKSTEGCHLDRSAAGIWFPQGLFCAEWRDPRGSVPDHAATGSSH